MEVQVVQREEKWEEGCWILDPGDWMPKEWERRRRQETVDRSQK
jgi:hypothetical protein